MKKFNRHLVVAASLFLALPFPAVTQADEKADAYKYGKDGIEAAKNKQWDKAIDLFQKAAKADPKEANNYNNLGLAYKGAGKMDEAVKAFGDAIQAELAKQPWGPRPGVEVSVLHGTIDLYGCILDERERTALRVLVESIPGVKAVRDHLVWIEPASGRFVSADESDPAPARPERETKGEGGR